MSCVQEDITLQFVMISVSRERVLSSLGNDKVVCPVVVVKVGGIECHALLDSGASSCYA